MAPLVFREHSARANSDFVMPKSSALLLLHSDRVPAEIALSTLSSGRESSEGTTRGTRPKVAAGFIGGCRPRGGIWSSGSNCLRRSFLPLRDTNPSREFCVGSALRISKMGSVARKNSRQMSHARPDYSAQEFIRLSLVSLPV